MQFNHGAFMTALRSRMGSVPQKLYDDLMYSVDAALRPPTASTAQVPATKEPNWLVTARSHMGLKEITGAKHNPIILGWVKELNGWFTDDETPWCGTFVAHCMHDNGIKPPMHWYRALAWKSWGEASSAFVGALAVFEREGGGHVGFIVGQSKDNWYILGGNQSNMVCIQPIAKGRCKAIRKPAGSTLSLPVPTMTGGIISKNEA